MSAFCIIIPYYYYGVLALVAIGIIMVSVTMYVSGDRCYSILNASII